MEIYSSLMGDNLAEIVLRSPYTKGDRTGQELWAVTGYISPTAVLRALYQVKYAPGQQSGEAAGWGELSNFRPGRYTPKIHLLVGMARDGAVSITTHEIFKKWSKASNWVRRYPLPGSSALSPGAYQALRLGAERLLRYCLRWLG